VFSQGADVNCMHGTLKPLHCACMVADADCVELLLQKGAEVNALDGYNRTALHYAAEKDETCVEILLEYGANPNALDGNKDTPLHLALLVRGLGTEREDSCFDLLHRAIGHFELRKNGSMPWEVTRDQQLCEKLTLLCSAPGTLQTLSRYAVRRSLGVRFLPEAVKQLAVAPLP
ncbi:Ankyrin repeat and SOCS box protein 8, partial [Gavia stellata]